MLREASAAFPDRVYMKERHADGWHAATFHEVEEEAVLIAGFLLSQGFARGERVTLLAEGRNAWVTAEFGVFFAGGISVPISVKIKEKSEIHFRMRHSASRFAITSERHLEKIIELVETLPDLKGILVMDRLDASPRLSIPLWQWPEVLACGKTFALLHPEELRAVEAETGEDSPVTLTYTSGTTAEPKGILLSHKNYFVNASDGDRMYPLRPPVYMLLILPWDHSFGQTAGLFLFLRKANEISAVEPAKTELGTIRNIPKNIREIGPTYLLVVPALVENFRKNISMQVRQKGGISAMLFSLTIAMGLRVNGDAYRKRYDPLSLLAWPPYLILKKIVSGSVRASLGGRLVFMVSGGSACSIEHQRWFNALGIPVYQGYGLSETSPIISANTNTKGHFRIGSSGKPFPWAQVRILGEKGETLAPGQTGEIAVSGECVMLGYWANEAATREAIVDGWFHTGDLGYVDPDGFLFVVGRIKSLLVGENGEKYSPEALEQHMIDSMPLLQQAMLYNQQNPYTVALLVPEPLAVKEFMRTRSLDPASDADLDHVIESIRQSLLRYRKDPGLTSLFVSAWTPRTFALLPEPFGEENGTMNAGMKIVRRNVVTLYKERIQRLYGEEEDPLTPANREVLRSWLQKAGT